MSEPHPDTIALEAAIIQLDEITPGASGKPGVSIPDLRKTIASILAWRFARTIYGAPPFGHGRISITRRDVVAALSAYGASYMFLNVHAGIIAHMIRNDFTDGSRRP